MLHKTLKVLPETGKMLKNIFMYSEPDTLKMEKNCKTFSLYKRFGNLLHNGKNN